MPLHLLWARHLQTGDAGRWGASRSRRRRLSRPRLRQATFKKKTVFGERTESSRERLGTRGDAGAPAPALPSAPTSPSSLSSSVFDREGRPLCQPLLQRGRCQPPHGGSSLAPAAPEGPATLGLGVLACCPADRRARPPSRSFFRAVTTGVPVWGL